MDWSRKVNPVTCSGIIAHSGYAAPATESSEEPEPRSFEVI